MLPLLGWSSPARSPSSVVLPLPDGPRIATNPPDSRLKLISFSTVRSRSPDRYTRVTDSQRSIGADILNDISIPASVRFQRDHNRLPSAQRKTSLQHRFRHAISSSSRSGVPGYQPD